MIYGYEQPVEGPVMGLYNTQMMLAAVLAAKDMYEKGEKELKDFRDKYSDFYSPWASQMEKYNQLVLDPVNNTINSLYEQGIDPLRSAEGRAAIRRVINSIPVGEIGLMKANAQFGLEYLKNRQNRIASGTYNKDFEELLLGSSFEDWDFDKNPIFTATNLPEFRDMYSITNDIVKDLQSEVIQPGEVNYDPRYTRTSKKQSKGRAAFISQATNRRPGDNVDFFVNRYKLDFKNNYPNLTEEQLEKLAVAQYAEDAILLNSKEFGDIISQTADPAYWNAVEFQQLKDLKRMEFEHDDTKNNSQGTLPWTDIADNDINIKSSETNYNVANKHGLTEVTKENNRKINNTIHQYLISFGKSGDETLKQHGTMFTDKKGKDHYTYANIYIDKKGVKHYTDETLDLYHKAVIARSIKKGTSRLQVTTMLRKYYNKYTYKPVSGEEKSAINNAFSTNNTINFGDDDIVLTRQRLADIVGVRYAKKDKNGQIYYEESKGLNDFAKWLHDSKIVGVKGNGKQVTVNNATGSAYDLNSDVYISKEDMKNYLNYKNLTEFKDTGLRDFGITLVPTVEKGKNGEDDKTVYKYAIPTTRVISNRYSGSIGFLNNSINKTTAGTSYAAKNLQGEIVSNLKQQVP